MFTFVDLTILNQFVKLNSVCIFPVSPSDKVSSHAVLYFAYMCLLINSIIHNLFLFVLRSCLLFAGIVLTPVKCLWFQSRCFQDTGIKSQAYIAPAGNIIAVAPKTWLNIQIYISQTILGSCCWLYLLPRRHDNLTMNDDHW